VRKCAKACEYVTRYPSGTTIPVSVCSVCGDINGYSLQAVVNDKIRTALDKVLDYVVKTKEIHR
jgi:hypothetical protein